MAKVIKDLGETIIKEQPIRIETSMEDFIKHIEDAEKEGVFDEFIAKDEEIKSNETSARLLRLLEDCIDTYCEMYKRTSGGKYVNFEIKFALAPVRESEYMGKATCDFIKHEDGKRRVLVSKIFGFRNVGEMRKKDWGEILLVQIMAELLGSMHVLSNLKENVKNSDLIKERQRQSNLKKKEDETN